MYYHQLLQYARISFSNQNRIFATHQDGLQQDGKYHQL